MWEDQIQIAPESSFNLSVVRSPEELRASTKDIISLMRIVRSMFPLGTFMYSHISECIKLEAEKLCRLS